jgi:hypothetical protein
MEKRYAIKRNSLLPHKNSDRSLFDLKETLISYLEHLLSLSLLPVLIH